MNYMLTTAARETQPDAIIPRSCRREFESRALTLQHAIVSVLPLAIDIWPTTCWLMQLDEDEAIGICMSASEIDDYKQKLFPYQVETCASNYRYFEIDNQLYD